MSLEFFDLFHESLIFFPPSVSLSCVTTTSHGSRAQLSSACHWEDTGRTPAGLLHSFMEIELFCSNHFQSERCSNAEFCSYDIKKCTILRISPKSFFASLILSRTGMWGFSSIPHLHVAIMYLHKKLPLLHKLVDFGSVLEQPLVCRNSTHPASCLPQVRI